MKKRIPLTFAALAILSLALVFSACEFWSNSEKATTQSTKTDVENNKDIEKVLDAIPGFTNADERLNGLRKREALQKKSLLGQVAFRNIGPSIMSGRVVDVEVNPDDPTIFYVAYASGGLWKTENNGISFDPIFDNEAVMTIGDIAVDWRHNGTIWVGTGENNSSRSSYAGTGIYKSNDDGKTWHHAGLAETHHTGRIILHPENPDIAWVAAIGHLYSENEERGVFKTVDAGKSWHKVLFVDSKTGVIDLIINPQNPEILFAAAWHRQRFAWNFVEAGASSGIYKSTDGGESWDLITGEKSGFPTGKGVGRIGLDISPENPDLIYAVLDNQARRPKEVKDDEPELTKDVLREMSKEEFINLDEEKITEYLDYFGFPQKYAAASIIAQVENDKILPAALVEYLENANSQLFDTEVIGGEVYISRDGGKTWGKTHSEFIDNFVYSYGYYFGQIRVSPVDSNKIYILGVPALKSDDGGKTFTALMADNVHVDHHALWINPKMSTHLILGNDGGINISYDDGGIWIKANNPPVGQFYTVSVDMEKPYNVYGGLQDNGVWYGPSTYKSGVAWQANGDYPYKRLLGGDGMKVAIDFRDNSTIYTGFQFGYYYKINRKTGSQKSIKPQHELGNRPPRFNWQTPVRLSTHNQDILYIGAEKLYRSLQGGEEIVPISEDLTHGGLPGDVPYGTLTTIDESPKKFGLLYVGSDDGLIHISKDGGYSWQRISDELPQHLWVSRVEASPHEEAVVFATLNGYRFDGFSAYLYKSDDYGKTWKKLGHDLPVEPLNVVVQDPENEKILYVGSDHGVYASLDGGQSFMSMYKDLPAVPVHDLVVHPRDKDLVVGTHGRSIFVANIEHVQQLTDKLLSEDLHLFPVDKVKFNKNWGKKRSMWSEPVIPKVEIAFYLKLATEIEFQIQTEAGKILKDWTHTGVAGLNYLDYELTFDVDKKNILELELRKSEPDSKSIKVSENGKVYLQPGKYKLIAILNNEPISTELEISAPKKKKRGI
ncbi:MAG: glycosyl hydrolase [Calditrichaeota bacterium]|nr:MAG: glycosyl hydrolase [Calditrichota bacterium]